LSIPPLRDRHASRLQGSGGRRIDFGGSRNLYSACKGALERAGMTNADVDCVLMCALGAGVSWGSAIVRV
jgi:3-oxoacyl-[acyl-carrier-protein] synthase III